jgi:dihydrodipicolinate synthase/N-acetylneuraminate lyase
MPIERDPNVRNAMALRLLQEGQVIPACPLALDSARVFDEPRQRALVRYYTTAGAGGLAVGVHTTQFAIRSPKFRLLEPVLRVASEEVSAFERQTGRTIVKIAGVCGSTDQAVIEAELAKRLGYDVALLSPGDLSWLSEEELVDRTAEVAKILPVMAFYLQPAVGGRRFTFSYWQRICELDNVVAIKVAPFDRYLTIDAVRACALSTRADCIALYTGNDDHIILDLLTNYRFQDPEGNERRKTFAGGLLGQWAVWTDKAVETFDKIRKARETNFIPSNLLTLAAQLTTANAAIFDAANGFAGCIAGIHEVLRRQGLLEGIWLLDPLEGLSPGQFEQIDRVYKAHAILNDDEFVAKYLKVWLRN